MNEIERTVWEQHDRRLNDHEVRFNQGTQNFTEIKDAIRQLTERINEGVSKTQQKLLEENKNLSIDIRDLKHAVELNTEKMHNKIDIVDENLKKRIAPLEESARQINKIYVWGVLTGLVAGVMTWGTRVVLNKLNLPQTDNISRIENLKAVPMRGR